MRFWNAEPEVSALRHFYWQFFVTLTFRFARPSRSTQAKLFIAWLRELENLHRGIRCLRLLHIRRFELGQRTGRGHLHACLSGLPVETKSEDFCKAAELAWRDLSRSSALVTIYDPARDGIGYVLKVPVREHIYDGNGKRIELREELWPTLSDSLIHAIRRGRYVRDGASRT